MRRAKKYSKLDSLDLLGGMKVTPWLWTQLHDLFDTDDGSLPEVRVDYSDTTAMVTEYALLRERAVDALTQNPHFWSNVHKEERPLDSVSNPAALVASGEAAPFHVVFGGIRFCGVTIPDVGVFVFPDELVLDYRMGSPWGPKELEAFFQLLVELSAFDPQTSLSLEDGVLAEVVARFQQARRRYRAEHAA